MPAENDYVRNTDETTIHWSGNIRFDSNSKSTCFGLKWIGIDNNKKKSFSLTHNSVIIEYENRFCYGQERQ